MNPVYDVTNHPELSEEAKVLAPAALASKAARAEVALGITGTIFDGADTEQVRLAIALQVNHTLRTDGRSDVVSESKGSQSITYARPKDGLPDPVDAEAARIIAALLANRAPRRVPLASASTPITYTW